MNNREKHVGCAGCMWENKCELKTGRCDYYYNVLCDKYESKLYYKDILDENHKEYMEIFKEEQ